MEGKKASESRSVKSAIIGPPDANNLGTMFGGKVLAYIDEIAGMAAMRHARTTVVTASIDSVDFLFPIKLGQAICLDAFVTWTHNTSMEVFVKVMGENLWTGDRIVCATAFLTFVALDKEGHQVQIPPVVPVSEYEKKLHETAPERAEQRKYRRGRSRKIADEFGML